MAYPQGGRDTGKAGGARVKDRPEARLSDRPCSCPKEPAPPIKDEQMSDQYGCHDAHITRDPPLPQALGKGCLTPAAPPATHIKAPLSLVSVAGAGSEGGDREFLWPPPPPPAGVGQPAR